jgi:hypothetical protein
VHLLQDAKNVRAKTIARGLLAVSLLDYGGTHTLLGSSGLNGDFFGHERKERKQAEQNKLSSPPELQGTKNTLSQ